jgi:type II secretory pathway component PulM
MKKYFEQLRPLERRLLVGVLLALFLVVNFLFVWPYFGALDDLARRRDAAENKLAIYQKAINLSASYAKLVKQLEGQGEAVAPEDQANDFLSLINSQSAQSGVGIVTTSRQITRTNQFFVEQIENITVNATDAQLVDFLYKLGSGGSQIRVRDLELQLANPPQKLNGNIKLVASYQKADKKTSATAKAQ